MALRDRFPAWFDAARFREAFVIEPAGLPLAETRYVASPIPRTEGVGVDVVIECTDDRGDMRAELWRRIAQADDELVATHAVLTLHDDPPHPSVHFQRHGIARRSLRRAVALYDDLGVRRIVLAATNAGRYVWPKFGFDLQAGARAEFISLVRAEYRRVSGRDMTDALPQSGASSSTCGTGITRWARSPWEHGRRGKCNST